MHSGVQYCVQKLWICICKIMKVLFAERCALLQNPLTPTASLLPGMGPLKCLFLLSAPGPSFSHSRLQIISVGSRFLCDGNQGGLGLYPHWALHILAQDPPALRLPEAAWLGWELCSFPASPKPKTPTTPESIISVRWYQPKCSALGRSSAVPAHHHNLLTLLKWTRGFVTDCL